MIKIEIDWDSRTLLNKIQKGRSGFLEVARTSMQEAGVLYRIRAREESGERTGAFKRGWGYRTRTFGEGEVELILQNADPNARYKLFPTKPHVIEPKQRHALLITDMGIFARVNHPGTRGNNVFVKLQRDRGLQRDVEKIFNNSLQKLANKL